MTLNLLPCPSCSQTMTRIDQPAKKGGTLALDLCFSCQGIWFDRFENLQLAPSGIVELFKQIHAHRDNLRQPLAGTLHCPHCTSTLKKTFDLTRSGRFTYLRCPREHGRFTIFGQFMIEKGFVRQLTSYEIHALAARIATVHCTGCGAPVDIRAESQCSHCGAAISILDPNAVEKTLAELTQATAIPTPPRGPEALADALLALEKQRQKARLEDPEPRSMIGDLVLGGIGLLLEALVSA